MRRSSVKISDEYAPYAIRAYTYWTLFLNKKQLPFVGRCYAWWNDNHDAEGEGMPFARLPIDAVEELQRISTDVTIACGALGYSTTPRPPQFLLNISYQANEGHIHRYHMHWHFIPRSKLEFKAKVPGHDLTVRDLAWGKNYSKTPLGQHELDDDQLQAIKMSMANAIIHEYA
jgi:hypothetical protein